MSSRIRWSSVAFAIFIMVLAAVIGGGLFVSVWSGNGELFSTGLLLVIPLLPAIVAFVLLSAMLPDRCARHLGFWIPFLLLLGIFVPTAVFPSVGAAGDGVDQMARLVMTDLAVSGMAAYAVALILRLTASARLRTPMGHVCPACGYPVGTSPVCTECGETLPAWRG